MENVDKRLYSDELQIQKKLFLNISNKPILDWTNVYTDKGVIAIEPYKPNKSKIMLWKFKCFCGKYFYNRPAVFFGKYAENNSCGCNRDVKPKGKDNKAWEGFGDISGDYFYSIKYGSVRKSKTLKFNITKEYIWKLFLKQNRKCNLSGLDIKIIPTDRINSTASLDRIDSSIGYIIGNVQWVHKDINRAKMNMSQESFIKMCKCVAEHNK